MKGYVGMEEKVLFVRLKWVDCDGVYFMFILEYIHRENSQ